MKTARVGLARAENRRENVYQSLDLVRRDIEPKLAAASADVFAVEQYLL